MHNNAKRWRLRLATLATLVATLIGGATLVAPGAASADTAALTRQPLGSASYILRFTITNDTNASVNGWQLEFDLPPGEFVQGLFAFDIKVTRTDQHFVLQNANPVVLNPGRSISTGIFIVGLSWPLNCVTRGTPCTFSP
ncbi:cellulose binding domain-containing protein [Dactylosporangium sp. NPDC000555]|uniref:cellulose binding domain-containing protein n=1 Tax=Dactylosporangium sp. NPDC000555 TaxID=3154260 RepID=UPI0033185ECE